MAIVTSRTHGSAAVLAALKKAQLNATRPGRFRYTDAQWAAIARELPQGDARGNVRQLLERLGNGDLMLAASQPKLVRDEYRRLLRDVSAAARTLMTALSELDDIEPVCRGIGGPTVWWDQDAEVGHDNWLDLDIGEFFDGLHLIAQRADDILRGISRRGRPSYDARDAVVRLAMLGWKMAGGQVRASGLGNGAKDGGPFIRYLIAATGPLGVQPALTVDAARELVRAAIKDPRNKTMLRGKK